MAEHNMCNIDPKNEQIHKILSFKQMTNFLIGNADTVTAACGKVWAPARVTNAELDGLPLCPRCFPNHATDFAISC